MRLIEPVYGSLKANFPDLLNLKVRRFLACYSSIYIRQAFTHGNMIWRFKHNFPINSNNFEKHTEESKFVQIYLWKALTLNVAFGFILS